MGMRIGITRQDVARAIIDYIADTGRAPTLRDIAYRMEIRNLSDVHKRVRDLRAAGFLIPARPNERGSLWPRELVDVVRDSARYMARRELAIPGGDA